MSEQKAFLEKINIKNFLSLRNVTLPFKPLTVLVGPNASGKSNVFRALGLLKWMMASEKLPAIQHIRNFLWAEKQDFITFQLETNIKNIPTKYKLALKAEVDNPIDVEELIVNNVNVISIRTGQGKVWDENGQIETRYNSNKLALKSTSNYEKKPITNALITYIRDWNFFDFQPGHGGNLNIELKPGETSKFHLIDGKSSKFLEMFFVTEHGTALLNMLLRITLTEVLALWHGNDKTRFNNVNDSLKKCINVRIDCRTINGEKQLYLLEGNDSPLPMERTSNGTLRLIAYYTLLNQPELPPLIAIEEPERNLHPGALTDIANVLEQLAERTQVIITTHSSQLLDNFDSKKLSDSLGILLLRNRSGLGTEVLNLEEIKGKREALDGWIADFGIGSAIFDSELLQDLMEKPI